MKISIQFVVLLYAVHILFFSAAGVVCAEEKTLRLGAIASLTGPAAEQGKNWLQGVELAIEEANKAGDSVTLLVEDEQSSPKAVASAFHLLANKNVAGIIGGTWDFLAEAAYPLAQHYKIPFITPTCPPEILSPQARNNSWIFTNGLSLSAESEAINTFFDRHAVKSVLLAYINVPFGTSHADLVRPIAKARGISIVAEQEITFEALLDTVRRTALIAASKKPDLIFFVSDYNSIDLLTKELQRLKSSPVILVTQHLDQAFAQAQNKKLYSNMYAIYPRPPSENFVMRFTKKFGYAPKVYADFGYDAAMFFIRANKANINLSNSSATFEYDGITSLHHLPVINRALSNTSAVIMTTKNGKFEVDG